MLVPQAALVAAAYAFETANGIQPGPSEREELDLHGLASVDPDELAQRLCHSITDPSRDQTYRQQACWALGKKRDTQLLSFFQDALRRELSNDDTASIHQLLIALDDLGEEAFEPSRTSMSIADDEANRRDAERYLQSARDPSRVPRIE